MSRGFQYGISVNKTSDYAVESKESAKYSHVSLAVQNNFCAFLSSVMDNSFKENLSIDIRIWKILNVLRISIQGKKRPDIWREN